MQWLVTGGGMVALFFVLSIAHNPLAVLARYAGVIAACAGAVWVAVAVHAAFVVPMAHIAAVLHK